MVDALQAVCVSCVKERVWVWCTSCMARCMRVRCTLSSVFCGVIESLENVLVNSEVHWIRLMLKIWVSENLKQHCWVKGWKGLFLLVALVGQIEMTCIACCVVMKLLYQVFLTRMVYLYYISCLRYTILVRNPQYVVQGDAWCNG